MKNNVLLIGVVEKCCPDETKMKCHILEKLKASEFTEALRIANEGLELGKERDPARRFVRRAPWFGNRIPSGQLGLENTRVT